MIFSPENDHVIVNYHYIEDPQPWARGIYPCSVAEFERQIAFLAKHYTFVSVPQLYEAAQKDSQKKLCAVTFDDGLRDQWENALPVLTAHGATATFFVITGTWEGKIPSAHKIHIISSRISPAELVEKFNAFVSNAFSDVAASYRIPLDRYLNSKRRHDDIAPANLKEMLNNIAPREISDAFLSRMLDELDIAEPDACKELFMNADEVRALRDQGFFVESHTHNHYSLDRETNEILHEDFRVSADALHRVLGHAPSVMAYPYGRPPVNHAMLADHGIAYGVTVESRCVARDDNPLLIPRFDTNDVRGAS